jgi:hypothetical protein
MERAQLLNLSIVDRALQEEVWGRYMDTLVVHFGEDEKVAGFSMVQLIETSLISAHFANLTNTTYLDVFSCKPYDPGVVAEFAQKFFGGKRCITSFNLRR